MFNSAVTLFDKLTTAVAAITTAGFTNLSTTVAPVAPAIIFGSAVRDITAGLGSNTSLAIGAAAAFTLEGVGFSAFHIALERKGWLSKIPAVAYLMIGIIAITAIKGQDAWLGVIMFGMVALAYATDAMRRSAKADAEKEARKVSRMEAEKEAARLAELEIKRLEAQAEADLKKQKLEAQKAVKLAEISAKVSAPAPESFQKVSESFPSDWRNLTDEHKRRLAQMTRAQIVEACGVTEKTAGSWLERLEVTQ